MPNKKHPGVKRAKKARKARVVTMAMELTLQANAQRMKELRRIRFPSHDGKVGRPKKMPDLFGVL
jgi:hypothetical protein